MYIIKIDNKEVFKLVMVNVYLSYIFLKVNLNVKECLKKV